MVDAPAIVPTRCKPLEIPARWLTPLVVTASLSTLLAVVGCLIADLLLPQSGISRAAGSRPACESVLAVASGGCSSAPGMSFAPLADLSRYQQNIHTTAMGRTVAFNQPSEEDARTATVIQQLVSSFQDQLADLDERISLELGVGVGDVLSELQRQVAIAVVGVAATDSNSGWAREAARRKSVVFAIDARGRIRDAHLALEKLYRLAASDGTSTELKCYEMRGINVRSVKHGDQEILLTWLGRVLVGAIAPEAMEAVILSYTTTADGNVRDARERDRI